MFSIDERTYQNFELKPMNEAFGALWQDGAESRLLRSEPALITSFINDNAILGDAMAKETALPYATVPAWVTVSKTKTSANGTMSDGHYACIKLFEICDNTVSSQSKFVYMYHDGMKNRGIGCLLLRIILKGGTSTMWHGCQSVNFKDTALHGSRWR